MRSLIVTLTILSLWFDATKGDPQTAQASFELQLAESKYDRAKSELKLAEAEYTQAETKADKARQLFAKGLISRRELASAEQEADLARAKHQAALDVERATGELVQRAREYLEKTIEHEKQLQDLDLNVARVSRSYGRGAWTVGDLTTLARDFKQHFETDLPITAFGQTHVHDRLGLNHEGRVDVGLHPESEQGRWVIEFLKNREIPFIAFTAEVPGSATGAHIHIGLPSGRK